MSSGQARIAAKNLIRRRHCKSVALPHLQQGATLSIRSHVPVTSVRLEPAWRDHGHVNFQQFLDHQEQHQQQHQQQQHQRVEMIVSLEKDQMTSLGRKESHVSLVLQMEPVSTSSYTPTANDTNSNETTETECHDVEQVEEHQEPGIYLTVQIPEKTNISVELNHGGSIFIPHGKVEGDARLVTTNGKIHVKKLRGQYLELKATGNSCSSSSCNSSINNNTIVVSDLLEAQKLVMETTTGRIRVKQIHARTATITVDASMSSHTTTTTPLLDSSSTLQVDDEGSLIDISSFYISSGHGTGGTGTGTGDGGGGGATLLVQGPCQPQRRAVRVKSHHGALQVETHQISKPREVNVLTKQIYPIVELGGVNGNVEVSMRMMMMMMKKQSSQPSSSDEHDENEKENENLDKNWSSCCVHVDSLSQDSVSLISVDNHHGDGDGGGDGDVELTLDRKVEADLRLASIKRGDGGGDCCLDGVSALLAEEEDEHLVVQVLKHLPNNNQQSSPLDPPQQVESRIDIDTAAFTPLLSSSSSSSASFKSDTLEYIQGWVENKSHEPDSRFDRKVRGDENNTASGSVGKIRIASAAEQALHGFTNNNNKTEETAASSSSSSSSSSYLRPLLAVVNNGGRIKVETVSWMGAIARRYGLEETERRDVGRTAAKQGRPFAWGATNEENRSPK